ncbi:MAG: hypothetical protein N2595_05370 [bacterium]|nr:hypothetical protein [bacterium]
MFADIRRRYRRVIVLLTTALGIALGQAAIYPLLYRETVEELYQRAYDAVLRGEHGDALRALKRLHQRVPAHEISHFLAGWAHHCRREYAAALAEYRLAIRYSPEYAQSYANAGYILFEQGRYAEAQHYFRLHLERVPDDAGSRFMVEECQRRGARERKL